MLQTRATSESDFLLERIRANLIYIALPVRIEMHQLVCILNMSYDLRRIATSTAAFVHPSGLVGDVAVMQNFK